MNHIKNSFTFSGRNGPVYTNDEQDIHLGYDFAIKSLNRIEFIFTASDNFIGTHIHVSGVIYLNFSTMFMAYSTEVIFSTSMLNNSWFFSSSTQMLFNIREMVRYYFQQPTTYSLDDNNENWIEHAFVLWFVSVFFHCHSMVQSKNNEANAGKMVE